MRFIEKKEKILTLKRAPSQFTVFLQLVSTGRNMTVKEIASEINLTHKATERAVAKLLEKGLIQRTPFRDSSYTCDNKDRNS